MTLTLTEDQQLSECINACDDCHSICTETVQHCLEMGGRHAASEHIRLLLDCAEICQVSANFMLRRSPEHHRTCGVCAELCRQCADSCEELAGGDEQMQRCARACETCADSCAQMAHHSERA